MYNNANKTVQYIRGNAYLSGSSDTSLSLATSDSGPKMTTGRMNAAEIYSIHNNEHVILYA